MKDDLREYIRRPLVRAVKYFLMAPHAEESKKIYSTGVTVDVSKGGLGMITDYPLKAGDILTFEDEIKINDFHAKAAVVRWAEKIEGNKYRAGLGFVDI
jgi:hypothetical protein